MVANPSEAKLIAGWLLDSGLADVRCGDGGDETLSDFQARAADVVVMTATLAAGDALALAGALHDERVAPALVLIGEEKGPVRTALDAIDFGAQRFLRRPLAKPALIYAVRSCAGLPPPAVQPPREPDAGAVSEVSGVPVETAALPSAGLVAAVAVATPGGGAVVAAAGALGSFAVAPAAGGAPLAPRASETDGGVARHAASTRLSAVVERAIESFLEGAMADAFSAPPIELTDEEIDEMEAIEEIDGSDDMLEPPSGEPSSDEYALEYSAEPASPDELAAAPPLASFDEPAAPAWREPTQILSGPSPTPPAAALVDAGGGRASEPLTQPIAPEEARTGTFVSELKRTMSAIEQRLFGVDDPAPGGNYDEAPPDIDLDAIAVDSTIPGVPYDGERRLPGRNTPLPVESDFAEDERNAEMEAGERPPPPRTPTGPGMRGDLREDDVAFLVARLHREGFSGRVTFRRGEAQKGIFFEEGRLVFATSNLPHDRMGDLLYREGKITREQHARSREIVAETGRRMGEILVEMGFLKRRELLPAVRRHVEDVIYSLFAWDGGTWSMAPGDGAQDEKIRLATHPTALVIEGIRRKIGLDRLRERMGSSSTVIAPLKRDDVTGALAEVDLSAEERRAADLFDGRRTLAEVAAAARLEETSVYQLAYGLVALGLARVLESRENTELTRGMNVHSAPAGAPSLVGAADVAIDRERVLAKHAHVLEADYFAVLGVRRDATAFEIRRAYEAARRDYAAEAFPQEVQREHAAELREVAAVLDEAYRVLRDDRIRGQYLSNLRE